MAIGIHAVFEGLSIGLETELARCVGIALAVLCHKWAEGLTLVTFTFFILYLIDIFAFS